MQQPDKSSELAAPAAAAAEQSSSAVLVPPPPSAAALTEFLEKECQSCKKGWTYWSIASLVLALIIIIGKYVFSIAEAGRISVEPDNNGIVVDTTLLMWIAYLVDSSLVGYLVRTDLYEDKVYKTLERLMKMRWVQRVILGTYVFVTLAFVGFESLSSLVLYVIAYTVCVSLLGYLSESMIWRALILGKTRIFEQPSHPSGDEEEETTEEEEAELLPPWYKRLCAPVARGCRVMGSVCACGMDSSPGYVRAAFSYCLLTLLFWAGFASMYWDRDESRQDQWFISAGFWLLCAAEIGHAVSLAYYARQVRMVPAQCDCTHSGTPAADEEQGMGAAAASAVDSNADEDDEEEGDGGGDLTRAFLQCSTERELRAVVGVQWREYCLHIIQELVVPCILILGNRFAADDNKVA